MVDDVAADLELVPNEITANVPETAMTDILSHRINIPTEIIDELPNLVRDFNEAYGLETVEKLRLGGYSPSAGVISVMVKNNDELRDVLAGRAVPTGFWLVDGRHRLWAVMRLRDEGLPVFVELCKNLSLIHI